MAVRAVLVYFVALLLVRFAIAVVAGMMAGSYAFALVSDFSSRTLEKWGDRGERTLPQLLHVRQLPFAAGLTVLPILTLVALSRVPQH